jgi:lactoylglutathione lyase
MQLNAGTIALGQIGLNVSDLDVSEGFYQEVLGLRVASESLQFPFRYASMARDGKTVLTLFEQTRGRFKKRRPGLHHLVFEANSVEQVERIKGLLDAVGAPWSAGARLYMEEPRAAIRFEDPDGILIEVFGPDPHDAVAEEMVQIDLGCATLPHIMDNGPSTLAPAC